MLGPVTSKTARRSSAVFTARSRVPSGVMSIGWTGGSSQLTNVPCADAHRAKENDAKPARKGRWQFTRHLMGTQAKTTSKSSPAELVLDGARVRRESGDIHRRKPGKRTLPAYLKTSRR